MLGWPIPTTGKEMASFLGFAGYYQTFIPKFVALTAEMNSLKSEKKITWTDTLDVAFAQLKEASNRKPIRAYPILTEDSEPFIVSPDFSGQNVGAVLEQYQEGQKRFIAAAGRKLTKGESNYPPTKGEMCFIVYACRKWEHLLRYKPFIVNNDHKALTCLKGLKKPTA